MGLDLEPLDVIGGGGSRLQLILVQFKHALLAIRPCRESETGWTPESESSLGNHSSPEVNERGPALKVFWPLGKSSGVGAGRVNAALAKSGRCG